MQVSPRSASMGAVVRQWPDKGLAYRLTVIAPTVSDVVASAGQWLFDRVKGGWKVDVFVADVVSTPSGLEILGVDRVAHLSELSTSDLLCVAAIAVRGEMLDDNAMLGRRVQSLIQRDATEVVVWGNVPKRLLQQCEGVQYVAHSSAARVFKNHALRVTGGGEEVKIETFHRAGRTTLRYRTDLETTI